MKREWEYVCRSGTTTPFHFGETMTTDLANYNGNYVYGSGPEGEYRKTTMDVGYFEVANAFGLYDLHGNVWEWCLDHWHDNYKGAADGWQCLGHWGEMPQNEYCGAVPGLSLHGSVALLTVTATGQRLGSTTTVFVLWFLGVDSVALCPLALLPSALSSLFSPHHVTF